MTEKVGQKNILLLTKTQTIAQQRENVFMHLQTQNTQIIKFGLISNLDYLLKHITKLISIFNSFKRKNPNYQQSYIPYNSDQL
ncbi:unnamed protein product [Paramecium sonneborni]|uniref:Uncharacterized protein n=1 Tax=Paramecium sonneborni TaxID=65129 RepID=A0A8S1Q452_9CILI|nr:unnamed protein product [Paramecium sonneborni]